MHRSVVGKLTVRGVALALLWLFGIYALFGLYAAAQVELEPRVFEIAQKLRCPVCVSETVAQSAAPTSVEMRNLIADKLRAGESEQQILGYFQARYGDWILLTPPRRGYYLVVWLAPIVGALAMLATVLFYVQRWTRRSRTPIEADEGYLAAVQQLTSEVPTKREA